jgi:large subunit ribosomal protein L6
MSSQPQTAEGGPENAQRQSRIGKRPVAVPKGVTVETAGSRFSVKGPKGQLSQDLPKEVAIERDGDLLRFRILVSDSRGLRLQGLARALAASMVKGVSEGYERVLEFVGTGYRCEVKGQTVLLQVGYSHPTSYALAPGVQGTVHPDSKGTRLSLFGANKVSVGEAAASIRRIRPPEPYAGKGIRYRGEQVRRKAGKAGKGRK